MVTYAYGYLRLWLLAPMVTYAYGYLRLWLLSPMVTFKTQKINQNQIPLGVSNHRRE
jgi:hypothetical protein